MTDNHTETPLTGDVPTLPATLPTMPTVAPALAGDVRALPPALEMVCPTCYQADKTEVVLSSRDALNCVEIRPGRLKWTGIKCPRCARNWAMEANRNEHHPAHTAAAHAPHAPE